MMCPVSLNPVMKITGTWANALFCLSRRQVSKPSVPGINASMRMTSGTTRSMMDSACSPSRATSTVMPASSIASVSMRNVSGESSTTRTMSRDSFLRMAAAGPAIAYRLERGGVAFEIECIHDAAHLCHEAVAGGRAGFDLGELFEDLSHVPDLAEADQLVDVGARRDG